VSDCHDDNFGLALGIDDGKWKAAKNGSAESSTDRRANPRVLADTLKCAFHIVEKRIS
jgi:hypothetical protein